MPWDLGYIPLKQHGNGVFIQHLILFIKGEATTGASGNNNFSNDNLEPIPNIDISQQAFNFLVIAAEPPSNESITMKLFSQDGAITLMANPSPFNT